MLHIINKSPFNHAALSECLRICDSSAAIILIEDGVYAALAGSEWANKLAACGIRIYTLEPDIDARGLTGRIAAHIEPVDYAGFVQLCCEHATTQSWY